MKMTLVQTIGTLGIGICLFGCAYQGPASPYQHFYQTNLADFRPPNVDSIRDADLPPSDFGWQEIFDEPIDSVWQACVEVGTQQWGILNLAQEAEGARRMLLVTASPPKNVGRGLLKPVDRWLAVALEPLNPSSTRMTLAWISPEEGRVTRLPDQRPDRGRRNRATDDQQFVARYLSGRFINDVKAALIPEEKYLEKFSSAIPGDSSRGIITLEDRKKRRVKRLELVRQFGYLESASFRRNHTVLSYPELERRLAEILRQLDRADRSGPRVRNIYILSPSNDNAKITSNGDLFLNRGLLESAESVDELAGMIAHELAHLYTEDHLYRQKTFQRTRRSAQVLGAIVMGGGAVATGMFEPPPDEPTSATSAAFIQETLLTTEEVLASAVLAVVGSVVAPQLVTSARLKMGDEFTSEYTQDQEMRADELATELLWYAGYRHDGLLSYFKRRNFLASSEETAGGDR